jgi:hypothetical protein
MATATKKRAKKPAKTAVKKAVRKAAKKGVPTLKQLLVRTEKLQAELTELIALLRRSAGGGEVVITDLESSGGAKIIQPLMPERG